MCSVTVACFGLLFSMEREKTCVDLSECEEWRWHPLEAKRILWQTGGKATVPRSQRSTCHAGSLCTTETNKQTSTKTYKRRTYVWQMMDTVSWKHSTHDMSNNSIIFNCFASVAWLPCLCHDEYEIIFMEVITASPQMRNTPQRTVLLVEVHIVFLICTQSCAFTTHLDGVDYVASVQHKARDKNLGSGLQTLLPLNGFPLNEGTLSYGI